MRILVTGANGITGHAVIGHLVARGAEVIGLVSTSASCGNIEALRATPFVGDLRDGKALRSAMASVERVYHICPAWVPDEVEIGEAVIAAAQASEISLFGYHSALAPHIEEIPSHWDKMQVQMALMSSGLAFSIFQPAAYMQNLAGGLSNGEVAQPHRTDASLSWVDVEDVGEAVAIVITRPEQAGGTYELCGTDAPRTTGNIADIGSQLLGRLAAARTCSFEEYILQPPYSDYSPERLDRLKAYYRFIDEFGMPAGNSNVLSMILGRTPTSFDAYIERLLHQP